MKLRYYLETSTKINMDIFEGYDIAVVQQIARRTVQNLDIKRIGPGKVL
jgi:hypothetical protein